MKNSILNSIIAFFLVANTVSAQIPFSPSMTPESPMRKYYKSKISVANKDSKITADTWNAFFGIVDSQKADIGQLMRLDSSNWKLSGNSGNATTYRLTVNVPRKTRDYGVMQFGFNVDSANIETANYGYMQLLKRGGLTIKGNSRGGDGIYYAPYLELEGHRVTNSSNWISGGRYQFAESCILNGEIAGFQHRIIAKDGITQRFHGIVFGQGLKAIQTGTSQVWLEYDVQNKGSIFIDGETGVGYIKKRDGTGIETYNRIVSNRTYTPISTNDPNGEIGDTATDDNYWYTKTNAGWKRIFLGSF